MQIKQGACITGLDVVMRPVLMAAESVWKEHGHPEGVTITAGLDGIHSAGSWHYYGRAVDFRTRYFSDEEKDIVARKLRMRLNSDYDVVVEKTHIHVEYDPTP